MTDETEIERLTQLYRRLGARDPAKWARSQVLEGIPQLARFVFLRQAWRNVVPADDASWVDARLAQSGEPTADLGIGGALQALMARGATPRELTSLVRGMQTELLLGMCQLLEDPGELEPEVADIGWVLVQVAGDGSPVDAIGGLPEIVLETDPAREPGQPVTAAPADEGPDTAESEAEAPEPTCGEELAQSAEIPDAVAVLMQHVALNLHAHANWVGRASEAAQNEHDAMLKVAAAYEDIAASAQRAAQTLRSFEHLPPAPHDAQQRDLPAFVAWMRTKITLQYELANLLAAHATESEGVLESVSG